MSHKNICGRNYVNITKTMNMLIITENPKHNMHLNVLHGLFLKSGYCDIYAMRHEAKKLLYKLNDNCKSLPTLK